jgi:hypothetical protein
VDHVDFVGFEMWPIDKVGGQFLLALVHHVDAQLVE